MSELTEYEKHHQISQFHIFLAKYPEFSGSISSNIKSIKNLFEVYDWDRTAENIEKAWVIILSLEQEMETT